MTERYRSSCLCSLLSDWAVRHLGQVQPDDRGHGRGNGHLRVGDAGRVSEETVISEETRPALYPCSRRDGSTRTPSRHRPRPSTWPCPGQFRNVYQGMGAGLDVAHELSIDLPLGRRRGTDGAHADAHHGRHDVVRSLAIDLELVHVRARLVVRVNARDNVHLDVPDHHHGLDLDHVRVVHDIAEPAVEAVLFDMAQMYPDAILVLLLAAFTAAFLSSA